MSQIVRLMLLTAALLACTKETENKVSRSLQDWTGDNGVLDVMSGGKVLYRFIKVEHLTTADESADMRGLHAGYRYGYGVLDINMNFKVDAGEKRIYFEVGESKGNYQFYQNPYEG